MRHLTLIAFTTGLLVLAIGGMPTRLLEQAVAQGTQTSQPPPFTSRNEAVRLLDDMQARSDEVERIIEEELSTLPEWRRRMGEAPVSWDLLIVVGSNAEEAIATCNSDAYAEIAGSLDRHISSIRADTENLQARIERIRQTIDAVEGERDTLIAIGVELLRRTADLLGDIFWRALRIPGDIYRPGPFAALHPGIDKAWSIIQVAKDIPRSIWESNADAAELGRTFDDQVVPLDGRLEQQSQRLTEELAEAQALLEGDYPERLQMAERVRAHMRARLAEHSNRCVRCVPEGTEERASDPEITPAAVDPEQGGRVDDICVPPLPLDNAGYIVFPDGRRIPIPLDYTPYSSGNR